MRDSIVPSSPTRFDVDRLQKRTKGPEQYSPTNPITHQFAKGTSPQGIRTAGYDRACAVAACLSGSPTITPFLKSVTGSDFRQFSSIETALSRRQSITPPPSRAGNVLYQSRSLPTSPSLYQTDYKISQTPNGNILQSSSPASPTHDGQANTTPQSSLPKPYSSPACVLKTRPW